MDEQELVNEQPEKEIKSEVPGPDKELEQERLHQERRAKRIAQMKLEKERQARLRSKMKLYIGIAAGCVCLIAAVIVSIVVIHNHKPNAGEDGSAAVQGAVLSAQDNKVQDGDAALSDDTAANSSLETAEAEESSYAADTEADLENSGINVGNGIFYPGYTAEITEDTPYISSENVISSYAILLDLDTGEVVAQRDAKTVISPASMTKILTLLVAAEHVTDLDDTFTMTLDITDYAYVNDCSTAGFLENEVVTVRDLMYGTILPSGGEAAAALAVYTAGSLDAFADMMNDKLKELGLSDTAHFTNCVGLYDENHHCSVYDMAMILKAAAENELCREVLSAHTYTTSSTEEHPEGIILSNWFLRRIEDKDTHGEVICAKTGFVNQSGSCGASYAISNSGKHYICVTGNAWSSWRCIYDQVEIYQEYTN